MNKNDKSLIKEASLATNIITSHMSASDEYTEDDYTSTGEVMDLASGDSETTAEIVLLPKLAGLERDALTKRLIEKLMRYRRG